MCQRCSLSQRRRQSICVPSVLARRLDVLESWGTVHPGIKFGYLQVPASQADALQAYGCLPLCPQLVDNNLDNSMPDLIVQHASTHTQRD